MENPNYKNKNIERKYLKKYAKITNCYRQRMVL